MLLAVLVACGGGSPDLDTQPVVEVQRVDTPTAPAAPTPTRTMSLTPPATEDPPPSAPLMELTVKPAFPALSLSRMVGMAYAKDRSDRLYVVLQPGRIVSFPNDPGADSTELFLDIRDRVNDRGEEEGLLGLAFDPQYAANGHFYVYYSASGPRRSVVSRFSVSTDGRRADPGSERVLLEVPQPFSNHNGGQMSMAAESCTTDVMTDGSKSGRVAALLE